MGAQLGGVLALKLFLATAQALAPGALITQFGRELVASYLAELGILALVGLGCLFEQPLDLGPIWG